MEGIERIITLAKNLITECEAQGFDVKGAETKVNVEIWDFGNGLQIEGARWRIEEGKGVTKGGL